MHAPLCPYNKSIERTEIKNMNYAKIKKCDSANGPGARVSLFVSRMFSSL